MNHNRRIENMENHTERNRSVEKSHLNLENLEPLKQVLDKRYGKVKLYFDRQTGLHYTGKKLFIQNKAQADLITNGLKKRVKNPNLYYVPIYEYKIEVVHQFCSSTIYLDLFIPTPDEDLKKEIKRRADQRKSFTNMEMTFLLYDIVFGMAHMEDLKLSHGKFGPEWVALTTTGYAVMEDPVFFESNSFGFVSLEGKSDLYLSPEVYKCAFRRQPLPQDLNYLKADVFSAGLVILEAGNLQRVRSIYGKRKSERILSDVLKRRLQRFKNRYPDNNLLFSTVTKMLEIDPKDRPSFKEIRKKLPDYQLIKQHFLNNEDSAPVEDETISYNNPRSEFGGISNPSQVWREDRAVGLRPMTPLRNSSVSSAGMNKPRMTRNASLMTPRSLHHKREVEDLSLRTPQNKRGIGRAKRKTLSPLQNIYGSRNKYNNLDSRRTSYPAQISSHFEPFTHYEKPPVRGRHERRSCNIRENSVGPNPQYGSKKPLNSSRTQDGNIRAKNRDDQNQRTMAQNTPQRTHQTLQQQSSIGYSPHEQQVDYNSVKYKALPSEGRLSTEGQNKGWVRQDSNHIISPSGVKLKKKYVQRKIILDNGNEFVQNDIQWEPIETLEGLPLVQETDQKEPFSNQENVRNQNRASIYRADLNQKNHSKSPSIKKVVISRPGSSKKDREKQPLIKKGAHLSERIPLKEIKKDEFVQQKSKKGFPVEDPRNPFHLEYLKLKAMYDGKVKKPINEIENEINHNQSATKQFPVREVPEEDRTASVEYAQPKIVVRNLMNQGNSQNVQYHFDENCVKPKHSQSIEHENIRRDVQIKRHPPQKIQNSVPYEENLIREIEYRTKFKQAGNRNVYLQVMKNPEDQIQGRAQPQSEEDQNYQHKKLRLNGNLVSTDLANRVVISGKVKQNTQHFRTGMRETDPKTYAVNENQIHRTLKKNYRGKPPCQEVQNPPTLVIKVPQNPQYENETYLQPDEQQHNIQLHQQNNEFYLEQNGPTIVNTTKTSYGMNLQNDGNFNSRCVQSQASGNNLNPYTPPVYSPDKGEDYIPADHRLVIKHKKMPIRDGGSRKDRQPYGPCETQVQKNNSPIPFIYDHDEDDNYGGFEDDLEDPQLDGEMVGSSRRPLLIKAINRLDFAFKDYQQN